MKKALAIFAALALVGSAVFAEGPLSFTVATTVSAWGNNGFQWVGNKNTYQTDDNFIGVNYSTENAGLTMDLRINNSAAKIDKPNGAIVLHNYSAWIKPASFVKFSLGTNVAVSAIGAESIRWNCIGSRVDEALGATMELTPIDGLYIGFLLKDFDDAADGYFGTNPFIAGTWGFGASYAISGIGTIAAQYRYVNMDQAISAGFKLAAVQNLELTVAGTAFMYKADNTDMMIKAEAFGTFNAGAFGIKFLERAFIRGNQVGGVDNLSDQKFGNVVKVEANYAITDTLSFNLKAFHKYNAAGFDAWDGGFDENDGVKANDIRVWASLPIAMGNGVTVTPGFMIDQDLVTSGAKPTWSIPVTFMYNF